MFDITSFFLGLVAGMTVAPTGVAIWLLKERLTRGRTMREAKERAEAQVRNIQNRLSKDRR